MYQADDRYALYKLHKQITITGDNNYSHMPDVLMLQPASSPSYSSTSITNAAPSSTQ